MQEREPRTMHNDEFRKMADVEGTHWWYRSLHNLVWQTIVKHFKQTDITIIDAGCGTGGLMLFLKRKGYEKICGFDLSATAVDICKNKALDVRQGDLHSTANYFSINSTNVIISNDTFYFFNEADQRKIADVLHTILKKDGLLILNMPALKAFRGRHDLQVGIGDRFDKRRIPLIFDPEKYKLVSSIYWPFLLSPLIWVSRFAQRLAMKTRGHAQPKSDLKKESPFINAMLFMLTRLEKKFPFKKPFGSSLFLVFKRL